MTNKQIMQGIFAELEQGNSQPLIEAMAEDFCWTVKGSGDWSRKYEGKQDVLTKLLKPLRAQFADQYTNSAHRLMAEDDLVVVESVGRVTTQAGQPYNNSYCFICRLAEGKLKEITEYCDTELVAKVLHYPKGEN
jgi:ketosteroid isomerase-like protein